MAGTERWGQLSGSLVLLLVLTAAVAAPASAASDGAWITRRFVASDLHGYRVACDYPLDWSVWWP